MAGFRVAAPARRAADAIRAATPATDGDATDVPCMGRHASPSGKAPSTPLDAAVTSGFARPAPPPGASLSVCPRDENGATRPLRASAPPTPTTSSMSAGELSVPQSGPSLPMADTTVTPDATTSRTLSTNGASAKSGPPTLRFSTSTSPRHRT